LVVDEDEVVAESAGWAIRKLADPEEKI